MNVTRLQAMLDQALATSLHRWLLMIVSVTSIAVPSGAIARATPFTDTWVVYCVALIAMVAAVDPGEQLGLILMAIVAFQWITLDQSLISPWSIALALCLHVFHVSHALMAVTPHSASIDRVIAQRWLARSMVVVAATVGVWLLAAAFERRELPGNVVLSTLAFAVLTAAVVVFRFRSLPSAARPD